MTKFLAGVLSVIAAGVLLIAYGLLSPRIAGTSAAFDAFGNYIARPVPAGEQLMLDRYNAPGATPYQMYYPQGANGYAQPVQQTVRYADDVRPARTVAQAPRRVVQPEVRRSDRDWKKTAMIIGGSSAAGAGVGAIFGGKKGALIGAAIGGGASTIYETTKR